MRKLVYIGEFPPSYGGVTTKNLNIKKYLLYDMDVAYVDLQRCKRNFLYIFYAITRVMLAVVLKQQIFIGLGMQRRVYMLLLFLKIFGGRNTLARTKIFVMASTLPEYCAQNPKFVALLKQCHKLYFELETMFEEIKPFQLTNYALLPNCRNGCDAVPPHKMNTPLKLLFFSRIHPQKGIEILFAMMDELDKKNIAYTMDFYGPIEPDFAETFQQGIASHKKAAYKGTFDSKNDNVYRKMNEYDLFLLPTTWPGESCCGAIVESKFAGIPAVVSDWHYNKELVGEGEGVVVERNDGISFAKIIEQIYYNKLNYSSMANKAYQSKSKYMFDNYRQEISIS
ncbi:glycosyltransferase [Selenomonas ruminantium]|uniref:glycosyltransferase n=1 Tax=Selenomonas ruminantium TaxID=971 RepID=UPI001569AC84|nr:glycosyltransferase [Selenomonas ruminantium]